MERCETYSTEGPRCPYCDSQLTADDPVYYDEQAYTEDECPDCGKSFLVSVYTQTSWTCQPHSGGDND